MTSSQLNLNLWVEMLEFYSSIRRSKTPLYFNNLSISFFAPR